MTCQKCGAMFHRTSQHDAAMKAMSTPRFPHLVEGKTFAEIAPDRVIVSMVNYKDSILIATPHQVYIVRDGKLEPLKFEYVP